jgi:uncharacterized protein (TIGR03382 family)
MRKAALALPLACGLVACDGEELASRSAPITHGEPTEGLLAVAAITTGGELTCTGTLVAPRVVVTAAHCLRGHAPDGVFFGAVVGGPGEHVPIAAVREDARFDALSLDHDLGVVILARAVDVPPIALPSAPLAEAALVGRVVVVVGFGATGDPAEPAGTKRRGSTVVTEATPIQLSVAPAPAQPCRGDSGGPTLLALDGVRTLVGVTAFGDEDCAVFATSTRVDAHADFLAGAIAAATDGGAAVGEACFDATACAIGTCVWPADAPSRGYCAAACAVDADCPAAMACDGEQCRYPLPSPGAAGAACTTVNDCERGGCVAAPDEDPVCAERCLLARDTCAEGFACGATAGGDGACFAHPPAAGCNAATGGGGALAAVAVALLALLRRRSAVSPTPSATSTHERLGFRVTHVVPPRTRFEWP